MTGHGDERAGAHARPRRRAPPPPKRLSAGTWLEPYPDALLQASPDTAPGPDARYETREAIELAFITALQGLPARQRAVLLLRDVLGFRASEVAAMLGTSEATVNRALRKARSSLDARLPAGREPPPPPGSPQERAVVDSFADAFENGDMDRVVALLTDDAWVTMPPAPFEYQGRETIAKFLHHVVAQRAESMRTVLVATRANGQPAFGHYIAGPEQAQPRGTGLFVLTLAGERIAAITRFGGAELLPRFGLPRWLTSATRPRC